MRISDWSSDVCSSDLAKVLAARGRDVLLAGFAGVLDHARAEQIGGLRPELANAVPPILGAHEGLEKLHAHAIAFMCRARLEQPQQQIGRASCRGSVCQYG